MKDAGKSVLYIALVNELAIYLSSQEPSSDRWIRIQRNEKGVEISSHEKESHQITSCAHFGLSDNIYNDFVLHPRARDMISKLFGLDLEPQRSFSLSEILDAIRR